MAVDMIAGSNPAHKTELKGSKHKFALPKLHTRQTNK